MKYKYIFVALVFIIAGCSKQEFGDIKIYIDRAEFGNNLEFSYNGQPLEITDSYLELYTYTLDAQEEHVNLDYDFDLNGAFFSSINGLGSSVELTALKGDKTQSYELRPTGDINDPFLIFDLNEDDNNNSGSSCFLGTWNRQDLTDCEEQSFYFSSNGTGWAKKMIVQGYGSNCTVLCNLKFNFNWTDNGDETLYITYTSIENDCGQNPSLPNSESIQVACNGSGLTIAGNPFN